MVYGICREKYSEQDFKDLDDRLELEDLIAVDPEKAQDVLNARMMQD